MALLNNKIKKWVDNSLISQQQADEIVLFEKNRQSWQGGLIVFLGIMAAALGISAIIGANWEIIPDWLKLSADGLLLLLLAGCGFMLHKKGRDLSFEFVLLFYLLFILASIGLIGQVFHTGAPFYVALGLWCFMSLGLFLLSKRMPVPFIWLAGLAVALMGWQFDLFRESVAVTLLPYAGLLFALISMGFAWIMGRRSAQARAAAVIFVLLIMLVALLYEFKEFRYLASYSYDNYFDFHWLLLLLVPCLLLLWLAKFYSLMQKIALSLGALWLLGFVFNIFTAVSYYINEILPLLHSYYDDIFIDPVSSFSLLAWLSFYAVASGYNRLFLLWLILAGCRICAIFLMAAYGLWQTGLALLVCGAILVAIPLLWKKLFMGKVVKAGKTPAVKETGHE